MNMANFLATAHESVLHVHVEKYSLHDVPDQITLALLVGGDDEDMEEDGVEEQQDP